MSSRENARIKKETEKLKEDTENARNQQRIEADRLRTATILLLQEEQRARSVCINMNKVKFHKKKHL